MDEQNVISISNVSKTFKIYHDRPFTLKEKLLKLRSNDYSSFFAVDDVSLHIKKGETVGLIGHNGCGKSTLLKLITKILYPDKGSISVKGRISSLIELGAGFHPDFTGRENIYTNASIFGLSKKEIDARMEAIIKFSELEDFIENPVRTYSSGMYMRLAFSVAINVSPEVLLIDEILSVGDSNFQKKCFEKIESFKNEGATIVIVSHDLGTMEKLCDRIVWMDKGKIVNQGEADKIIDLYQQHMNGKFVERKQSEYINEEINKIDGSEQEEKASNESSDYKIFNDEIRWGSKEVEIMNARIINENNQSTNVIMANEKMTIEIDYKINSSQDSYIFGIGFYSIDNVLLYGCNTEIDKIKLNDINEQGTIRFIIPQCNMLSNKYKLNVAVVDKNHRALDFIKYYMDFTIVSSDKSVGFHSIDHYWEIN